MGRGHYLHEKKMRKINNETLNNTFPARRLMIASYLLDSSNESKIFIDSAMFFYCIQAGNSEIVLSFA